MNTLTLLDTAVTDCERCALRQWCNQPVPGITIGAGPIKFLFVGEYPETGEDIEGEAFVDRAGYNFRRMLEDVIHLPTFRLTYIVKCKPGKASLSLINEGAKACFSWMQQEINIIQPKVIVSLGILPLQILLNTKKNIRLKDYIGRSIHVEWSEAKLHLYPFYSITSILNRGKKLRHKTIEELNELVNKMV